MNPARVLRALAGGAARRPTLTVALACALGLASTVLALRLHTSAATSTFVSSSSSTYKATQRFYKNFGEEPVEVLVKGELQQLLLSSDIGRLVGLEGCLSGNVPAKGLVKEGGANGPCGQLARLHTVKVVLGPGTFLNEAAEEVSSQLASRQAQAEKAAKEAERVVRKAALAQHLSQTEAQKLGKEASKITLSRFAEEVASLALQYGLTSPPGLYNPSFVSTVVFDPTKRAGTPKGRFAYLFPSRDAALISVRMKAGISEAGRERTIKLIRAAVRMPQWHLTHGESYMVTGEPVIVGDLAGSISRSLKLLLVAVLAVMAISLSLILRSRPRLLPLAIALLATAVTFAVLALTGASLTVGDVAVLPVLIGLSVDYCIQFQSRFTEELDQGNAPHRAVLGAVATGAPAIATAALASAAAMCVLTLSPVPTVRGFGLLLVLGIVVAFLAALTAGSAALVLAGARRGGASGASPPATAGLAGRGLAGAWQGARELLAENPLSRFVSHSALTQAAHNPRRVLFVAGALALIGWGLDTQTSVQTDLTKLVPQNLSSLRALNQLERDSGVGGEIALMVSATDLAKPSVIDWMDSYQQRVLSRLHYSSTRGCGKDPICPAFSLPDLFENTATPSVQPTAHSASGSAGTSRGKSSGAARHGPTQAEIHELLGAIPPYFSQDVITADRRVATLSFGIRLMPLSEQEHVIEQMRSLLHPPKGVSAQLVGLPVLAAESGSEVASVSRRLLDLVAALIAVALVLLAAFRGDGRRVLVAVLPVLLASGWSALILFALRVPLNPLSVTLGALVIAISTEFSVLLSERHRQERLAGHSVAEALRRSYQRTGAAIAASGVTAIAGFGVLVLSDISMLRDFGLVTLVNLSVSLIGVLVVLPSVLTLAEHPQRKLREASGQPTPDYHTQTPAHDLL